MRSVAVSCAVLAWLAGCAVVPPQAWTFDPARPQARAVLDQQEIAALGDQVAQLQLQRNDIRNRIAAQPDAMQRQQLYAQLHSVGMKLSPLERRLGTAASGR